MNIDLTQYVVAKWGAWFLDKEAFSSSELRLGTVLDGVTLAGPLCIRVAVQARNQFTLFGTSAVALQARDVFSYKLDIPPGQTWTYPGPRALRPQLETAPTTPLLDAAGARLEGIATRPGIIVDPVFGQDYGKDVLWGSNAGFGVAIRACGPDLCADPCAPDPCRPVDPCAPKKDCHCGGKCGCGGGGGCGGGCGCGCHEGHGDELPCDFATGSGSRLGAFFPAACEPCAPGAFVGMPPQKGPSLMVPAARGGTVRTRYFNGMFITKEDLWADQNNNRIKHALMNRAMGQGVVWGFDVCLDGDVVCVLPGYGVDCCGNDIVVSCAYRVDSQALLRDPAASKPAFSTGRGARRMSLLLEYYECPEEPRPVHGDPCAPDSVRCEMSRIRETARLRLVPPCDVDDSGCIKDFLDEVKKLKGDRVVGPILTAGLATPAPSMPMSMPAPTLTTTPATSVPFQIVVKGITQAVIDPANDGTYTIKYNPFGAANNVSIAVEPASGVAFTGGRIKETQPVALTIKDPIPGSGFSWQFKVQFAMQVPLTDVLESWTMTQGTDQYAGDATLEITGVRRDQATESSDLKIVVRAKATVTRPDQQPPPPPSKFPCWSEACDPTGRPRFPVAIPWLHEDPGHPGQAADPKVIVLAILYALFVSKIAPQAHFTTESKTLG